jgi:hypothetical protein
MGELKVMAYWRPAPNTVISPTAMDQLIALFEGDGYTVTRESGGPGLYIYPPEEAD